MQFKKHFSSNLQNLSVKKTLIVNPPPPHGEGPLRPSPSRGHNKQNMKENQAWESRAGGKQEDGRTSPLLSFNKIKRNAIDMMHAQQEQQHHRQLFHPIANQPHTSRTNLLRQDNAHTDSSRNICANPHSKTVRMGSMVFGSLKRDESKAIRESRSIDRVGHFRTQRDEAHPVECSNGDGEHAKYKVSQGQGQEELLSYCFNCAISLVKQGFPIEELTPEDRRRLSQRQNHSMSRSDFLQRPPELGTSRFSRAGGAGGGQRVKVGEQAKCRIIMRLNKLRVGREQFNKSVETHLDNIDYFYQALSALIEQQRVADRQELLRMKAMRKADPENYESQLSSALGTIDYMMKNLQGVNYEFLAEVEALLEHEVAYPKMRINVEPIEGFQHRIEQFSQYFDRNLKICLQEDDPESTSRSRGRLSSQADESVPRNHPLRFSFEQALQQVPRRANFYQGEPCMNPLEEESESELEESLPIVERRQNAFRNLFPEDEFSDSDMDRPKQSPVFKQF